MVVHAVVRLLIVTCQSGLAALVLWAILPEKYWVRDRGAADGWLRLSPCSTQSLDIVELHCRLLRSLA
jgi:hypothetical protein